MPTVPTTDVPSVLHLSCKGVAKRYGKSVRWVREMVRTNRIPHLRIGGAVIFSESVLAGWEQLQPTNRV